MDFNEFESLLKKSIHVGDVFNNPKRGTSEIKSISGQVCYIRGSSSIYLAINDMYTAYIHFAGQDCSSNDLKAFMPAVYDSQANPAGHGCNCTFLFRALEKMGLADSIEWAGVNGTLCRTYFREL